MNIIKRDGREVELRTEKIENALHQAYYATRDHNESEDKQNEFKQFAKRIADFIKFNAEISKSTYTVEEIQEIVEDSLINSEDYKDIGKAYIRYREDRTIERRKKNELYRKVKEKLSAKNVQNQNANVDEHSFGGRRGEADSEILRDIALNDRMSRMARENHLLNRIYHHDLDSYELGLSNCLSVPFDHLLASGFNTRQTDVRPAKSVNTAFQLVAVLFQLQSLCQFGGVSATHLDFTMVPYVRISFFKHYLMNYLKERKDFFDLDLLSLTDEELDDWADEHKEEYLKEMNLTKEDFRFDNKDKLDPKLYQAALFDTIRETYQAVEGMYHNLNTLQSRSGNQLPFSSINYGACTEPEGRLIIKALLEVSIKGIGKLNRTSIFPCGIFQLGKGINRKPGDPNFDLYQLAVKSTCRRLYPNYANLDWSGNAGYDKNDPKTYFATMGCRTANGYDINGFGQLKDGRGNICPVTVILPTIAMEAKEYAEKYNYELIDTFFKYLTEKIDEAKDMLIERFDWITSQDPSSAKFMWENGLMVGYVPEEGIRSAMKHGTLALGQLGLAETLQILIHTDHTTDEGMELAKRIESLFSTKCKEYKEEYKLNFGVYYTPAENLCYTAMKKFQAKYGKIKDVSDRDYFTNSMHVPVWKKMNPFEKIDIESQLTGYSSAGCITYVELGDGAINNEEAVMQIIEYAMDKDIPYFAINVPNDTCNDCGFSGIINDTCPKCGGKKITRLRRVTGYLTNDYKTAFNKGKQEEVEDRYCHSNSLTDWRRDEV